MRAAIVGGLILAVGCSKPDPPTLVPEKASLTRIDPAGIELAVELTATNPNSVDLTLSDVASRVVVGNQDLGTVRSGAITTLPAGRATKIVAPLTVTWPSIGALAAITASGGDVPYSVDGTIEMGGRLVHVRVPFHVEGRFRHDEIVEMALKSIPGLPP